MRWDAAGVKRDAPTTREDRATARLVLKTRAMDEATGDARERPPVNRAGVRPSRRRFAFDLVVVGRGLLLSFASAHLAVFLVVALRRCVYPFELEWMEGAMVAHVDRVLHGQRLYVAPTVDFVPFIYGPVFFWVSAIFAKVMGVGFAALRLVSIVASIGSLVVIHALVARETRDRIAGVVAAGAFAASYVHGAQFLDLGRVDALALFLSLAAMHLLRHHRSRLWVRIAAAALLGLSFMTKQSMLLVAVVAIVWEIIVERKRAIPFVVATLVFTLGFAAVVDAMSDGWFRYYVWDLPRGHMLVKSQIGGFWADDLFPAYAIAGVAAAWWLLAAPRPNRGALFHFLFAGALVGGAWIGRLHDGGWPNVLIPAFASLTIFFGLGFAAAFADAIDTSDVAARKRRVRFVLVAAGAQLAVLAYDPSRVVPKREDADAGRALVARLQSIDGDVFVPNHTWYGHLAGKRVFAHRMAIDDVIRGDPFGEGPALAIAIRHAIETKRWGAIVLDDDFFEGVATSTYRADLPPFAPNDPRFFPVTGIRVRPTKLYVLK